MMIDLCRYFAIRNIQTYLTTALQRSPQYETANTTKSVNSDLAHVVVFLIATKKSTCTSVTRYCVMAVYFPRECTQRNRRGYVEQVRDEFHCIWECFVN